MGLRVFSNLKYPQVTPEDSDIWKKKIKMDPLVMKSIPHQQRKTSDETVTKKCPKHAIKKKTNIY